MSTYEEERQQQIRENAEFLASLGIETAVPKRVPVKRVPKNSGDDDFTPKMEYNIRRRSSLISYSENNYDRYGSYKRKKQKTSRMSGGMGLRTSNPGRRIVGGRVYDSEVGSTCHQCRQKTMDPKIHCSNNHCNVMFDEHCLEIRYNEYPSDIRANGEENS
ncbi:Cell division cycle-associated 7-like protein, partial [Coemansia sp. RSA 2607]